MTRRVAIRVNEITQQHDSNRAVSIVAKEFRVSERVAAVMIQQALWKAARKSDD